MSATSVEEGQDLVHFTSPTRADGSDAFVAGLNYEAHIVLSSAHYGLSDEGPGPMSWVELSPGQARRLAHMLVYLAAKAETVPAHGA
jgi:hypothetical protein